MNDSRRRRPLIKQRAEKSKDRRLRKELKKLCEHGGILAGRFCQTCNPKHSEIPKPVLYRGWVYFKDGHDHRHAVVDIRADKITQKVQNMHEKGFWACVHEGDDYTDSGVMWVAPHEIRRIIFWKEDVR